MIRKNKNKHKVLRQSIILFVIFCSIISSINAISAADNTYYWNPSSGAVDSSGFTANWGNCNAQPTSYRITTLSSTGFTCNSDRLTTSSSGDQYLAIFPTAYSSDTQVTGKTGATFYLSSQRSGYTATYRFDLGYASSGTFTSLGYVTRSVSSSNGQSYTIDMSSITGTAPAGSYLTLKVSVTTSRGGRVYLGTNGGSTGSNSGRFYVNETAAIPPAPTYNVTITASPASAAITQGSNYTYYITVNNNGNTNGDYTLAVSDSDSTNFVTPSALGRTSIYVPAGGSNTTTLKVTAKSTAAEGATDTATVTATSIQDPSYADSTTPTTTVQSDYSMNAENVTKTYYWIPSSGAIDSSGFTANWGSCNAQPTSYRITTLSSTGFTCNSDRLTRTSSGDQYLAIFPTAYSSDTQVTGKTGATFYLSSQRSGYTATYRFDLGYARSGTFTSLGYVTRSVSSSNGQSYTIDMSSITGTAPAGSYLALKVSATTSRGGRVYLGTNGGSSGSNSGRFYVNETATIPPAPTYNVTITASPASAGINAGNSHIYTITVNNTGNANGNYTLNVTDSDTVNFTGSTLSNTAMQVNSGGSAMTTLNVTAKANATIGAIDNTIINVISVENPIYTNSANVQTTVTTSTPNPSVSLLKVSTNRFVVLDDPIDGSTGSGGFFNPSATRGGSWGSNYWSGESTTIRANAIVMNGNGSRQPVITVTFTLKNPGGSIVNTGSSITDGEGAAYYSFDMNARNYWGNWKVEANATLGSNTVADNTSFVSNWWGCPQCHNSESPGNWGTRYTPKSYYTMGYDFHRSQNKNKHTDAMAKGTCIICHQSYNGTPKNWGFNDNSPNIPADNEYSPDWHKGKVVCAGCHAGSNISSTPQGKNPEIAGCYDTPGCHPKKNTNISGEYSTSGYVVGGNYRSLYSNIPASADSHTVTSVNCIICHNAGHNISKPYNGSFTSNSITENEQCWTCHTQRTGIHYGESCTGCHSQDIHNVSVSGGGPDCISCHDLTGSATHKVDASAIAAGVHSNLNSGATASGVPAANKKCWGCHQSDGNQPEGMGDKYSNPYRCYECHGPTKPYARVSGAMTIDEHFKNGTDVKAGIFAIDDSNSCALCHSVPEMRVSFMDNEYTELSIGSHYGRNRSDTVDCQYCHQNTSTAFAEAMMGNIQNSNLSNHSRNPGTPVCTTCHGSGMLHNATLTKPTGSNDTYCKTCHVNKNEHKTVNCAECHTNNTDRSKAGREIHGIRYLQNDNTFSTEITNVVDCTACHQSDLINSSLVLAPPQISDPLHHSDDINNGSIWGNYWTSRLSACLYCHNDTKHSATPLGRPLVWNPSYVLNTTIGNGTNCADCHYRSDSNYGTMTSAYTTANLEKPPEITNGSWNAKPGYYNHTLNDYTDSQCKSCHDKSGSTTVGQIMHNASIGSAGGPDCKACHDIGGSAPAHVNFSVSGGTDALHSGLNSGANATVDPDNKKCWSCHGDGTQPASGHPSNYTTPKTCENCHVSLQGGYNPATIMKVDNHYQNGMNITTASVSLCQQCHNKTEMMLPVYDPEAADNPGHYGKKRSDLGALSGTNEYCTYCHNSTENGATFYVSSGNNSIVNHSTGGNTPLCNNCHSTGRLHDSSLVKPASSDDTYCKTCHGTKNEHKTLYCTECHANNTDGSKAGKDVHGIKFLQKDNTFSQGKTNAVDCTTCHQSGAVDSSLGITPVKISNPLHHSDDALNGSKWGSYWADQADACLYCHNDTKHSATPLGRPLVWNSSYVLNTPIGTGTNCADCHYQGDGNYGVMSSAFTGAGLNLSPEITSGSWNGKPGYYNHSLGDYTDSQCKSCHDKSGSTTVGQIMHNASIGSAGGPDCKACHDAGGSAPNLVNFSAANNSGHKNLNSGASSTVDGENKKCWACHGDGNQPGSGHPSAYMTPAPCENCHSGTGRYSAPLVKEHNQNGSDVQTTAACVLCHDNNGMFIDSAGIGTITHYIKNVTDTTTTPYGHSGAINTTNCIICHLGQYTNDPTWDSPVNISTSPKRQHTETTNTQCDTCHKDSSVQTLANVDFHNAALTAGAGGTNCLACHAGAE